MEISRLRAELARATSRISRPKRAGCLGRIYFVTAVSMLLLAEASRLIGIFLKKMPFSTIFKWQDLNSGECQVLCFSGLIFLEPQVG
jgi:hypothetical protein